MGALAESALAARPEGPTATNARFMPGALSAVVLEVNHLPKADLLGKCDPFVRVPLPCASPLFSMAFCSCRLWGSAHAHHRRRCAKRRFAVLTRTYVYLVGLFALLCRR